MTIFQYSILTIASYSSVRLCNAVVVVVVIVEKYTHSYTIVSD